VGHLAQALRDVGRTAEARIYEEKSTILVEEFGKLDSLVRQIIATDQVKRQEADALAKNVQLRYEAGMALLRAGRREEGRAWLHSALQEDAHHEPSRQALEADFEKDRKSGGKSATPTAPARGQGDPVNTPR
jgi:thioredoxin-like negative regulator of GroEL